MKADTAETIKPIQRNGVTVRIRRTEKNGFTRFVVDYRVLGQRKLVWRSSLADARAAANDAIEKITEGQGEVLNLKSADAHAVIRARACLDGSEGETKIDLQIDEAVRIAADVLRLLDGRAGPIEVARDWLKRNAVELPKITVAGAVEQLKVQTVQDGKSKDRQIHLASHLGALAKSFNCEAHTITTSQISSYLVALPFGERTKANHREDVGFFNRWLILHGYLPKGTDWLDGVQRYSLKKVGKITTYTADEMRRLIAAADKKILPFIVIAGFAGIRHAEINRLDWQDVDLEENFITVAAEISKTQVRRVVPIKPNLKAFLLPLAKKSGKVVTAPKISKLLSEAATKAGNDKNLLDWKRNALRHTYISARLAECNDEARVAYEAGNSPQIIRSNYDARIRPAAAAEWFAIMPPGKADNIVQLPRAKAIA
jgi:integrase